MNSIPDINVTSIREYFLSLQKTITDAVLALEQQAGCNVEFLTDSWQRPEGGDGRSCVLEHVRAPTKVFEKAGVNFSHIRGENLPRSATANRPDLEGRSFEAMGVSVVMHPHNPYAPTSHMNVRFFIAKKDGCEPVWWFGGGFDLTPYYPYEEDCMAWHLAAAELTIPFEGLIDIGVANETIYQHYKKACDNYFYLKHRKESRGIGGLFVDDLNAGSFENCYAFIRNIGQGYLDAYMPIMYQRYDTMFGERQRAFQVYRRGRYVEFNLVFDRGTLFGLQTAGRIESILMSLPPVVEWRYNWSPEALTEEAKLLEYLQPREWL